MSAEPTQALLDDIRFAADRARSAGQWQQALDLYCRLPNYNSNSAVLLNRAICYLASGDAQQAYDLSILACKMQDSLWQAKLILAKAAKALGRKQEWVLALQTLYTQHPANPEILIEYAPMVMNVFGHAVAARNLVKPLLRDARHGEAASSLQLMTLLYDRPKAMSAKGLTALIRTFAREYLKLNDNQRKAQSHLIDEALKLLLQSRKPAHVVGGQRRVGFVSGLFSASPVYFLSVHAIREVAQKGHQLIFFDRGGKHDWATAELKSLATEWIDCRPYEAPVLEAVFRASQLDELFDMAGWTDLEVLKALNSKPAKVQFKWVGGQSCTTGLNCFDGFVTDDFQTPRETFDLYTEPLVSLGKHYVKYTPPPYMPQPRNRPEQLTLKKIQLRGAGKVGVVANPLKISAEFLSAVKHAFEKMPADVRLIFIDSRYTYRPTRNRITTALGPGFAERVVFSSPTGHPGFLSVVNELDLMLDTFPYSGGLTLCEAIHLKVPVHVFRYDRKLFCERHVLSHLQIL